LVLVADEGFPAPVSDSKNEAPTNVETGLDNPVPEDSETPTEPGQTTIPTESDSQPQDSTPTDTQTQPETTPAPAPEEKVAQPQTVASDVVEYQYGVIQLELTHQAGTIMNVSVLQGDTSYGRGDTYAALINATVAAQGTNFGNYSGATFTTEAFRSAVASATAKF
jgi:uncharacterized protein with FMN-binding domain